MRKFVTKEEVLLLTTAEAKALVKQTEREKGIRWALVFVADAPVMDKPNMVFPLGCHAYLNLSKKDALRMAGDMLSEALEARGGRIRVVKSTTGWTDDEARSITYWLR